MADPLITELEDKRALDSFNPHKGAGPDGLIHKVSKALNSHISSELARVFNLSVHIVQVPGSWRRAIVTPTPQNPPLNRLKAFQTHQPHVCRLQYS